MEGKTVMLSVLILTLVMAQIQVEAKTCCPSTNGRNCFNACRLTNIGREICASVCGCQIVGGTNCPWGFNSDTLENIGDSVNEYCTLGCASSVCGALSTLQNSVASEIANGAAEQCTKACSTFCTKGSVNAVKTA